FAGVQHAERDIARPDSEERRRQFTSLQDDLAGVERRLDTFEPVAQLDPAAPVRPAVQARRNVEGFPPIQARFVRFTVLTTNDGLEPCIDELEVFTHEDKPRNIASASSGAKASASSTIPNSPIHRVEHLIDGRYGNGRSWISNERGRGWVQVELPRTVVIDRVVWGRDREERC